jgi:rubrerythrin
MNSKLFPLTSFVALFGGPGIHGYGSHTIDSEEVVSKVIINGMDGIEELIGSTKASKLMIDNVTKVEVTYNRVDESCMATTIIRSKRSNTLEDLWERASAGSKKRQREDDDHTKEEGINLLEEWTCNACTFIHIGIRKRDFLACELCGSTRTECPDNI